MNKNIKHFKEKVKPYKNTLVISLYKIVRLVDVIDGNDDYYWVYDDGNEITHSSCVMHWIPLKGQLSKEDYEFIVSIWNNNNKEKAI